MKYVLFSIIASLLSLSVCSADDLSPRSSIPVVSETLPPNISLIDLLSIIQKLLLKGILPIIVVGTTLYIAYQLFTADGDETRLKQAWKSLTYGAIALVIIALSYTFVAILSNLSF
ncbi:hypothetical protein KBD33_02330 [Candidatus Gracilibacteria bacterium]|nr:hypothetical protein [Candidatus Gracilibacteria bacterium]